MKQLTIDELVHRTACALVDGAPLDAIVRELLAIGRRYPVVAEGEDKSITWCEKLYALPDDRPRISRRTHARQQNTGGNSSQHARTSH